MGWKYNNRKISIAKPKYRSSERFVFVEKDSIGKMSEKCFENGVDFYPVGVHNFNRYSQNEEVTKMDSCDGSYRRCGRFEKNDSDENHIRVSLRQR